MPANSNKINTNRKAFLDMIAFSEGTSRIPNSDNGYRVIVGSTPAKPILMLSYADHPRRKIFLSKLGLFSSAAGRYQILARYYDAYKQLLGLPDFSPKSQDCIAIQMIKERGALYDVDEGFLERAIEKCRNIWASFPEAGYHQHERTFASLQEAFTNAGGLLSGDGLQPTEPPYA